MTRQHGMRLSIDALRRESYHFENPQTEREKAILTAATRLFGEKGYSAARTAEIAAEAGVTERTLFRYFRTKEELYYRVLAPALLEAAFPRELTSPRPLLPTKLESLPQWERRILKTRLEAVKRSAPQSQLLLASLLMDGKIRRRVIKVWREELWRTAIQTIRRYQERGEVRKDMAPENIARMVISVNLSYVIARVLMAPEQEWDDKTQIEATADILLNGIRAR